MRRWRAGDAGPGDPRHLLLADRARVCREPEPPITPQAVRQWVAKGELKAETGSDGRYRIALHTRRERQRKTANRSSSDMTE